MSVFEENEKKYALMQPAFVPWMGWFALMDFVDKFVIYDDAQFSKQSWHHRNKIKTSQGELLMTIPIAHKELPLPINQVRLSSTHEIRKIVKSIAQNYSKSCYFEQYFEPLKAILENAEQGGLLLDLTGKIINWAKTELGITTEILNSSSMNINGKRGEYVAKLGKDLGIKSYISPLGARDYLSEDRGYFDALGMRIYYLDYQHPPYTQINGAFLSHCGVIDLLFNEGPASLDILRSGVRIIDHGND
jgi:hypothetical protein